MKSVFAFVAGRAAHFVVAPLLWVVALVAGLVAVEGAWNLWGAVRYLGWEIFSHSNSAGITFLSRLEIGALVCLVAHCIAGVLWNVYEPRSGPENA